MCTHNFFLYINGMSYAYLKATIISYLWTKMSWFLIVKWVIFSILELKVYTWILLVWDISSMSAKNALMDLNRGPSNYRCSNRLATGTFAILGNTSICTGLAAMCKPQTWSLLSKFKPSVDNFLQNKTLWIDCCYEYLINSYKYKYLWTIL